MNTALRPMYAWQDVPWRKVERAVFKLQKRIYQASRRDDIKTVHKLHRSSGFRRQCPQSCR